MKKILLIILIIGIMVTGIQAQESRHAIFRAQIISTTTYESILWVFDRFIVAHDTHSAKWMVVIDTRTDVTGYGMWLAMPFQVGTDSATWKVHISTSGEILLNGGTYWLDINKGTGFTMSGGSAAYTNDGGINWYQITRGTYVANAGNADTLDTQHGSYYQDPANMNAGTFDNDVVVSSITIDKVTTNTILDGTINKVDVDTSIISTSSTTFLRGDILWYDGANWVFLSTAGASPGEVIELAASGIPEWDSDDGAGLASDFNDIGWTFPFSAYTPGDGIEYRIISDTYVFVNNGLGWCIQFSAGGEGTASNGDTGFDIEVDSVGAGAYYSIFTTTASARLSNGERSITVDTTLLIQTEYPINSEFKFVIEKATASPSFGSPIHYNTWGYYKKNAE